MTEQQQYRVIAGATMNELRTGDLAVVRVAEGFEDGAWSAEPGLVRIERPVPTTDEPTPGETYAWQTTVDNIIEDGSWSDADELGEVLKRRFAAYAFNASGPLPASPSVPTREQIAEASYYAEKRADYGDSWTERWEDESGSYKATYYAIADAVLALLQKGAGR